MTEQEVREIVYSTLNEQSVSQESVSEAQTLSDNDKVLVLHNDGSPQYLNVTVQTMKKVFHGLDLSVAVPPNKKYTDTDIVIDPNEIGQPSIPFGDIVVDSGETLIDLITYKGTRYQNNSVIKDIDGNEYTVVNDEVRLFRHLDRRINPNNSSKNSLSKSGYIPYGCNNRSNVEALTAISGGYTMTMANALSLLRAQIVTKNSVSYYAIGFRGKTTRHRLLIPVATKTVGEGLNTHMKCAIGRVILAKRNNKYYTFAGDLAYGRLVVAFKEYDSSSGYITLKVSFKQ